MKSIIAQYVTCLELRMLQLIVNVSEITDGEDDIEIVLSIEAASISKVEWDNAEREDETFKCLKELLNRQGPWNKTKFEEANLMAYWSVADELHVHDKFMMRGDKIIPPSSLRQRVIELGHEGHHVIIKTKQRIRNDFWWPGCDLQIERYIRDCILCSNSVPGG